MDKYDNLVSNLLLELRGDTAPVNIPSPQPTPTSGTATAPGGLKPTAPATATTSGAGAPSPVTIRGPGPMTRAPGPKPSGGAAGTLGLALTIGALTWEGLKSLRKQWREKQAPIPMTLPPGYKEGDVVLPPIPAPDKREFALPWKDKPTFAPNQGFAVPAPIAPPQPKAPPEQQPATPERKPVVVPPVIPLRPGTPEQPKTPVEPEREPVIPAPPEPTPQPDEPERPDQTRKYIPTPLSNTQTTPSKGKEPEVTSSGEPGAENATPVPSPADTSGKYLPPVLPIDTSRKAIKPGRADDFDFKSYPQGYNPDEPYGRWGPKSAHRDTTQTSPWDLMKQTFTGTEPEVTSATPETETGPWAKRYKRYKDQYQDNPEAGQPTSFGNILKKSK